MFNHKQTKAPSTDKIETIIGTGTSVHGNLNANGTIRVDGQINGEIHAEGDIIIGATGHVTGIVRGRNITIAGRLDGNADAEGLLHLASTAVVKGDIVVDTFTVEEGAKYKGSCQMKYDNDSKEMAVAPAL